MLRLTSEYRTDLNALDRRLLDLVGDSLCDEFARSDENLARGLEYLKSTDLRLDLIDLLASGKVRCPVYIFQSENDGIVRASNARFLSTVFPHAELEMISGGEHALPVSIPEKIDVAVASCVL